MTGLETHALILDDRRRVLQLPDKSAPGNHCVRIEIDPITELV